jgi:hypothetical protein
VLHKKFDGAAVSRIFAASGFLELRSELSAGSITPDNYFYYDLKNPNCFCVEPTGKAQGLIALGECLIPTRKESQFQGGAVWMKDWGIWNEHSERIGSTILTQMRLASPARRPLIRARTMLFDSSELYGLHPYFVLPLLFGWDAFVVPAGKEYFVFVSHYDLICVVSRTRQMCEQVFARIKKWMPKKDKTWYFQGLAV